jgi:hypothetical protein
MRFSLVYDDIQAVLVTSMNSDNATEPVGGAAANSDLDLADESGEVELSEAAERLPSVPRQK